MMIFLEALTFWHWLIFGAALMALEIFIFGAFFLWLGLAAIVIGLVMIVTPLAWTLTIPLWAILSVVLLLGFLAWRKRHPAADHPNTLNQRGQEFVGQTFTLTSPVINGHGEMRAGDTVWKVVSNHDLSAGTSVTVTGVEGVSLRILPI